MKIIESLNKKHVLTLFLLITVSILWIAISEKLFAHFRVADNKDVYKITSFANYLFIFVIGLIIYQLVHLEFKRKIAEMLTLEESQLEMKESFMQAKSFMDNAPDAIFIVEYSGKLFKVNKSMCDLIEYDKIELLRKSIFDFDLQGTISQHINFLVKNDSEQQAIKICTQFTKKSGQTTPVEISTGIINIKGKNRIIGFVRDESKRVEADQNLKKNEQKYRDLFNNALVGMAVTDLKNGSLIDCNDFFVNLTGYNNDKALLIKEFSAEHYYPDIRIRDSIVNRLRVAGKIENLELQLYRRNKELYWVEASFFLDKANNYIRVIINDIQERKKTEQALIHSTEKYSRLYENSLVGLSVATPDELKFVDCNLCWANLLGYQTQIEALNKLNDSKSIFNLTLQNKIAKCLKIPHPIVLNEVRFTRHDKSVFWCSISISYNKTLKLLEFVFFEITEQKLARTALLRSEEKLIKLTTAVEQSGNQIYITSTNGEIEYINAKFTEVTGFTEKEALGKNPNILNSDYHTKQFYQDLWQTISSGKIWKNEMLNKKKDGEVYWESSLIAPVIDKKGEIINYIAVKEDITERKLTEHRIFKTVIETEEKERRRFAEDLHDELGPYLSGIKLYADRILRKEMTLEERKTATQELNAMINESITKTREISNSLMPSILTDFGLIRALKSYITKINKTEKILINLTDETEELEIEKNKEVVIYRIIIELINNTIKYANASKAQINFIYDTKLSFTYSDNGVGFDLEKELNLKSGLGLSNITNRIKAIDGEFEFSRPKGEGILFQFRVRL